eukprot:2377770-Rhodomonas_salina.1
MKGVGIRAMQTQRQNLMRTCTLRRWLVMMMMVVVVVRMLLADSLFCGQLQHHDGGQRSFRCRVGQRDDRGSGSDDAWGGHRP